MTVGRIVDVSSAQHPNGAAINWPAVARAGVTTALIKATEGDSYANPYYEGDRAGALAAGLDVLAYHYAGWGIVAKEVEWFVAHAGAKYARLLDIETSTNVGWVRQFLQGLGLPSAQLATYGSASSIGPIRGQIPSLIWVAAYPAPGRPQLYPGYGVLWQFTDAATIPGIPVACDESSWHGTETQYDDLFGKFDPPAPPPTQEEPEVFIAIMDGAEWLCSGSTALHITSPADLTNFQAAGIKTLPQPMSAGQFALFTKVQ